LTITFGTLRIGVNNTINYHYQGGYGDCDVGLTSGTFSCTTAATAAIRNLVTATWGTHGLTGFLLKEDGGKILQEDGTSGLLLET
jgi:hypothetical protein